MKSVFFLIVLLVISTLMAFSQRPTIELTFTAVDNAAYVQLDSIKVMNRTQGRDTVLYWPDTVLSIHYVGIKEIPLKENAFHVFQNYPNPVADQTTVSLYVPVKDKVGIIVTDILGRMIIQSERVLEKGKHSFQFTPGRANLYFITAQWRGNISTIKILNTGINSGETSILAYKGIEEYSIQLKTMKDIQEFTFNPGDELLYIGYADTLQSGILDSPDESATYTFQFATNIPCPGTPSVEYEGQVYNTIQIFSQCWMKENLNVGSMISGGLNQTNNSIKEKYCYFNYPDSCTKYGGLYQWDEVMQYTTQPGAQGICPPSWHLPTDEEWKVLEGAADSQDGIGDNTWDNSGYRGTDAGTNLRTTIGWNYNGNGTDLFGFSGLPGGGCYYGGYFADIGSYSTWLSSTDNDSNGAWTHGLDYDNSEVYRGDYGKEYGFSVRCIRDY